MRILFAVSNDNITTSVVNKYQQKYKEIITSKNVYYFNAIIKELQKNKSYDAIVIGEDLEPISNNNYEAIDKFLFEKLDGISDEASKPTGDDIPIIFICSDRRSTADRLLIKLFGIGIYNAIIGNDRSIDTVCNLINKPRNKKEAKLYYKIESEDVGMYENSNEQDVSETEIQNILSHYRKIGSNVKRCVESFDKIAEQYNETQLRVIVNFFPAEVKSILEENSNTYRKLMMGGTVLSNGNYSPYNRQSPKKPGNLDVLTKDLEKTNLSKPVIIPSTININNKTNQNFKSNGLVNQNVPNNTQVQNNAQVTNNIQGVKEKMQPPINNNTMNNGNNFNGNSNFENNRNLNNNYNNNFNSNANNGNYNSNFSNNNMNNGLVYNGNANNANTNNINNTNNNNLNNNFNDNLSSSINNDFGNNNNLNSNFEDNNAYSNNNEVEKVVPEMAQKRGRGRPRKIISPVVQPINSLSTINNTSTAISELPTIQPMDNMQKRKRGRPSKKSLENVPNSLNTELNENNNIQEQTAVENNNQNNNQGIENQSFNIPQEDVLPGLEESNDAVDLFSMDPIDDSIMDLDEMDSSQNGILPGFENDIENLNNNSTETNNTKEEKSFDDNNLFDLDIEETNTNQNNTNVVNNTNNDINSNPYSDLAKDTNNVYNQNNSPYSSPYGDMNTSMYESANSSPYGNMNTPMYESANSSPYGDMNTSMYESTNNSPYGNMKNSQSTNNNSYAVQSNAQDNYNSLMNTQNQTTTNVNTNVIAGNGKIVSFIGTSKNGISFIVNNLSQLLSQSGIKTAILDLTKNKNSYYMFTDNDSALMKKATESMKNLSKGIIDGLNVNKNLTVFTSLPDEIEILNSDVMLQTLSNNYEIILLDCDYDTDVDYFVKSNEIYLVQSMDTFTIQPLTQFLSNLKLKNALDESKLRIIINKYVRLKKLDEKMIIGGMSKYNEPSMTLQRDLFNAQNIKYVCIPFETETYARYLESIAMCNLSLNGYSQTFLNSLEELRRMVYPLVSGGYSNNAQNNTEEKHGLFGGKKYKTQQSTQFSNNVNDTLNKMRTNNF